MNEYPDFFARFYDLIYHSMRDSVDHDYFQDEIRRSKGKVLEVGTGTGRLFAEALKNGADIYGIDISPAMLDVLYRKLPGDQKSRVSLQNIIDFRFDFRFSLVVAPFRVFMHINEKNDQIRALNNIYDHLEDNGKFIFDTFIPDLNQLINGLKNVTDFDGEYSPGKKVRRTVSTKPDLINQLINIEFLLEWDEDDGRKQKIWNTRMRYFFRYELEHLVERSKFKSYSIAGDYQGHGLENNSKEFVVTCCK